MLQRGLRCGLEAWVLFGNPNQSCRWTHDSQTRLISASTDIASSTRWSTRSPVVSTTLYLLNGDLSYGKIPVTDMVLGTVLNRNAALDPDAPDSTDAPEGLNTPLDEANIMLQIILESIRSLFRIGVLVRKSSPRDRFKRALQASQMAVPASFDIDRV